MFTEEQILKAGELGEISLIDVKHLIVILKENFNNESNQVQAGVKPANGKLLKECCEILGWQGGTIHQVIEEIKRLKKYNNHQGCKGCRYNVDEVDMWFPEKCPNCARSEREDLYESRLSV